MSPAGRRAGAVDGTRRAADIIEQLSRYLTHGRVEKRRPILNRLKREADQNQAHTKRLPCDVRVMIDRPFDKGRTRADGARDYADGESGFQADGNRVVLLLSDQAAG